MIFRSAFIIVVSLCVMCASWYSEQNVKRHARDAAYQLRTLRIEQQDAEQYLQTLKNGHAHPLLQVLGEDVTSLQLRLAQFLSSNVESRTVIVAYEQSLLQDGLVLDEFSEFSVFSNQDVQILRLDVEASLAHAPEWLNLLWQLNANAAGWPMDVRACDAQRMPTRNLSVRCIVDIYFWKLDVTR